MAETVQLQVEICYAAPDFQIRKPVRVDAGATVQQAIMQSGVMRECTAIDLTVCRVGIYGKLKTLETVLRDRDRIEIYRPLIADPMDSRRRRVAKKG
ncbi:RnfH family protein [Herbaspirillum lusitanum]|uniref:RnfH family protein n=1 Tax=Herbaspirillum lusitanum TaxID=213312 RepID=UPI0022370D74|nr:RnfH family protein [Herbaspirillum lusitanum]MCW5298677.1 RnfH family protein [Herbaspirillum lusitanum]